jgi:ppGpp synthetase/RelA/SpoT-type nucleotidyltranferase
MAWTKPQFPHYQVDKAGTALCDFLNAPVVPTDAPPELTEEENKPLEHALKVLDNWRSAHSYPLQVIKMNLLARAKKMDKQALVAQRLKRIPAIIGKLIRFKNMKLSKMHDIGGCRAVMQSVSQVDELVSTFEAAWAKNPNRGPHFVKKYDYLEQPKNDGYRSVHLVYRYRSASRERSVYNGLRIEVQLRSRLQHAWATAVETVSTFTGQALKSNIGEASWKRFFLLMGSAIALIEKRKPAPDTPSDLEELKRELEAFSEQLNLLAGLGKAVELTENVKGHIFLLLLDSKERRINIKGFSQKDMLEANAAYLELEKNIKDKPEMQAVLVSVNSFSALRRAYPNYFLDIDVFLETVRRVLADS